MNSPQLRILQDLRFSSALRPDDVWQPPGHHVDGVNEHVDMAIRACIKNACQSNSPLGLPIVGAKGSGKTHSLAVARQLTQQAGGPFFLVELSSGSDFWRNVRQQLVEGLGQPHESGHSQLQFLLNRLAEFTQVDSDVLATVYSGKAVTPEETSHFSAQIRRTNQSLSRDCRAIASALLMLNCDDTPTSEIAEDFLHGSSPTDQKVRAQWNLPTTGEDSFNFVRSFSRLAAMIGPIVLTFDQFDKFTDSSYSPTGQSNPDVLSQRTELNQLGSGLMKVRESMRRTALIVSCMPNIWDEFVSISSSAVNERFSQPARFLALPSAEKARELVAAHFNPVYSKAGFAPPYPTWPIAESAFVDAVDFHPRDLLRTIQNHVENCARKGQVIELTKLEEQSASTLLPESLPPKVGGDLDRLFAEYRESANVSDVFDSEREDVVVPDLLACGLRSLMHERGHSQGAFTVTKPRSNEKAPGWHTKLSMDINAESEAQRKWTFGFIAQKQWNTVTRRIQRLQRAASLDPGNDDRKAILARTGEWQKGKTIQTAISEYKAAGGHMIEYEIHDDLRTFAALLQLEKERPQGLTAWLMERKPASDTKLAREIFSDIGPGSSEAIVPSSPGPVSQSEDMPQLAFLDEASIPVTASTVPTLTADERPTHIALGYDDSSGTSISVPVENLRKHTAIFAGSGSGKTVLIRRLIEECALRGIPAIVLDPNNDLARLGDPWPEPPPTWLPGDEERATRYLHGTEVAVWTPRINAGRPVTFQPLPDFRAVLDDADQFDLAIEAALEVLIPRAGADRNTKDAKIRQAVLRSALRFFALRHPTAGLKEFIDFLAELPDDVVGLAKSVGLAHDMSQVLEAAMINDPMFGGNGTPLDPGHLLTASEGSRARISVISLIGLPNDEQRQHFVNQLQMGLFSWFKQNPTRDRPLGGLYVMDEAQTFAPSEGTTPCSKSTQTLAAQARKYGLGLVFATQKPKGLHNGIVGNAATQFYGFLNALPQIQAAKEMARSKTSQVVDISRLKAGQFYAVSEGLSFQKVSSPMCLSHHPPSPLSGEEIIDRARRKPPRSSD